MKEFGLFLGIFTLNWLYFIQSLTLKDILPIDYDRLLPPNFDDDGNTRPVNVSVNLYVLQIRSINEVEMDFKMDAVIRQIWKDPRLLYPKDIYQNRSKIVLDPNWKDDIWTPDVWFKNALDTKLLQWVLPITYYWLRPDKTVVFAGRVTLDLSCDMDMQNYPHDSQLCGVSVMALMNPSTDLVLNWDYPSAVRLSRLILLPQFEMGEESLDRCDTHIYGETFSCINASFRLIRRSGYFIINIYIPTILIVTMSMLTFWIPPEAVPARITLGVTSLLTIITKQYQSNMPSVSYIVAMNIWISSCIGFVFCSLLEYAIVISLLKKRQKEVVPETVVNEDSEVKSSRNVLKTAWQKRNQWISENFSPHFIDLSSRVVFPMSFIIFCIIYSNKHNS